jgi:hypothetical protein
MGRMLRCRKCAEGRRFAGFGRVRERALGVNAAADSANAANSADPAAASFSRNSWVPASGACSKMRWSSKVVSNITGVIAGVAWPLARNSWVEPKPSRPVFV